MGLKKKMTDLIAELRTLKKDHLANCIEQNWHKTALAYSKELNVWRPKKPMEKELLSAFNKEIKRAGMGHSKEEILHSLTKRRILQTAPHLVATENPRMLCINWLSSLGVPKVEYYVVGMYSGVPFSNSFRPGRINMEKDSINLFPSSMQDGLVYQSKIPAKMIEVRDTLPDKLSRLIPWAKEGKSYTKWALESCRFIDTKIIGRNNLVYLDLNEIVAEYLILILKKRHHVLHKILFETKEREEFIKTFPEEAMFYTPVMRGKYEEMEGMKLIGDKLKSKSREIDLHNKDLVLKELKSGRLCPGLLVSFLSIAFLNEFKCLGSFAQVEYLPTYQTKLAKLKILKDFQIERVPTANLTTGVFPGELNLFPVDFILKDIKSAKLEKEEKVLFGELLLPMKDKLLGKKN